VENVGQKRTFLHTNWPPTATLRQHPYFSCQTVKEWTAKNCGISKANESEQLTQVRWRREHRLSFHGSNFSFMVMWPGGGRVDV